MIRAAGILYVAPNGHVLLVRRTDGQGWAFPGGGIEDGESAEEAARRELFEETGETFEGSLTLWTRRVSPGLPVGGEGRDTVISEEVDFTTFLAKGAEFEPTLNAEHDAWQWVDRAFALSSSLLHPGVPIALRRFEMHELDMAKAIVSGELTSPQRYENLLLVAIRITGTGVSYRGGKHDEFPWRDPSLYLNPEFLERCNGLPVILEHPDKTFLNTKEFRNRIVGTIFLPYIKNDEVWGIAKILDMEAAEMLESDKMSTSPAVFCGGLKYKMKDGTKLLIEEEPTIVDHIALLFEGQGVWDKGLGMAGVESIDAVPIADSASPLDDILRTLKLHDIAARISRL
jgi:8-oxo-dGTP pyrophosphatase MutT (NUDIX family)